MAMGDTMDRPKGRPQPALGQWIGLMLAGAVIGVAVFGGALAIFDAVRDRLGLHWSSELLGLLALFLVFSIALTVLACWLLGFLMVAVSQRAVANALTVTTEPDASHNWTLRPAPPSVSEHTTYMMKDTVPRVSGRGHG